MKRVSGFANGAWEGRCGLNSKVNGVPDDEAAQFQQAAITNLACKVRGVNVPKDASSGLPKEVLRAMETMDNTNEAVR
jgi:hypothetical protein